MKITIIVLAVMFCFSAPALALNDGCDIIQSPTWFSQILAFQSSPSSRSMLLLGDSITARWPDDLLSQVGDDPQSGEYLALVNRGIGGNTICGVFYEIGVHVLKEDPEAVVVSVGINDIAFQTDLSFFLQTYANTISVLHQHGVRRIYTRSILPTSGWYFNWIIPWYNQLIQNISNSQGAVYLNTYPHFLCGTAICPEYTVDGTHLTREGYIQHVAHFWDR